jgi:hypothetical protein
VSCLGAQGQGAHLHGGSTPAHSTRTSADPPGASNPPATDAVFQNPRSCLGMPLAEPSTRLLGLPAMICAPSTRSVVLAVASALRDRDTINPSDLVSCGITYCASEPMYWIEAREEVRATLAEILSEVIRRGFPIQRRWVLHAGEARALIYATSRLMPQRFRSRRKGPHRALPKAEAPILPASGGRQRTRARPRT